jgi:peptidoglycan-associated lipoprotein
MKFPPSGALALAAVLLLAGCSATGKSKGANDWLSGLHLPQISTYKGLPPGDSRGAGKSGQQTAPDAASPSKQVIYFQYDSSDVQPQYLPIINNNASYLAANPGKTAVLEGHTDERGSPEYNIALGEQRGKAIANLMKLQGVVDSQIQIVSYGEENPDVPGHDDQAWQQNRRVVIYFPGSKP